MTSPDRPVRPPIPWFIFLLMAWLTLCFAAQQVVVVHLGKPYDIYVALSDYGMKSGHFWELFTYQFLHLGVLHFLVNLCGLWFLGRPMETRLGTRKFIRLYWGAVLVGGLVQGLVALAGYLLPESLDPVGPFLRGRFGGPVVGASVGLCAVWTVFCLLEHDKKVRLLFLLPVKTTYVWGATLAIAILLVILPTNRDLAHLAHLTGLLTGLVLARRHS
jgi:membrane associated rhomboid family serine protease